MSELVTLQQDLATDSDFEKIFGMLKVWFVSKGITQPQAEIFARYGNLPVMRKVLEELFVRISFESQNTIVRTVKNIPRSRTAEQLLSNTGRNLYLNAEVAATLPVSAIGATDVKLVYFRPRKNIFDTTIVAEYDARGLTPDLQAQAFDNECHPEFALEYPNAGWWKIQSQPYEGRIAQLLFSEWANGERRIDSDLVKMILPSIWFAGVERQA